MVFEGNNKMRKKILQTVQGLTDEEFNRKPVNGGWSPKQILEHLSLMETLIATNVAKELKNPESPKAMKKPISMSTNRIIKVEAPGRTVPSDTFKTLCEMKQELHNSRLFLLDVYDSSNKEALMSKSFKHPIFGQIPLCQWFPFVGMHEKRHLKQLKDTIESLQLKKAI